MFFLFNLKQAFLKTRQQNQFPCLFFPLSFEKHPMYFSPHFTAFFPASFYFCGNKPNSGCLCCHQEQKLFAFLWLQRAKRDKAFPHLGKFQIWACSSESSRDSVNKAGLVSGSTCFHWVQMERRQIKSTYSFSRLEHTAECRSRRAARRCRCGSVHSVWVLWRTRGGGGGGGTDWSAELKEESVRAQRIWVVTKVDLMLGPVFQSVSKISYKVSIKSSQWFTGLILLKLSVIHFWIYFHKGLTFLG